MQEEVKLGRRKLRDPEEKIVTFPTYLKVRQVKCLNLEADRFKVHHYIRDKIDEYLKLREVTFDEKDVK